MKNVGALASGAILALICGTAIGADVDPIQPGAVARLGDDFGSTTLVVTWGDDATQSVRAAALAAIEGEVIGTDEDGAQLLRVGAGLANARSILTQFPGSVVADVQATDTFVSNELGLTAHQLEVLSVPGNTRNLMYVPVVVDGGLYTLELRPTTVRTSDFKMLVDDGSGNLVEVAPPTPTTYRGRVVEIPGSVVAASIDDTMTAQVLFNDHHDDGWYIQPLADAIENAPSDVYVVYHGDASQPIDVHCGGALAHDDAGGFTGIDLDQGAPRGTLITAEIAYDADFQFYQLNGSSQTSTIADIENVQNGINTVYERDCNITFQITQIIVRTSSGTNPYTSNNSSTLLNQFRSQWLNNHQSVHRDLAHLMTGRNVDGSVIGIAWLSAVCTNNGFGLSQSRFTGNFNSRVALTAHEVGHNFSAEHCDGISNCRIMCSGLGGCNGIGLPNFGPTSISSITGYAANRPCLDSGPPANEPPSVVITTPVNGSVADEGSTLFFSVFANDPEDGNIGGNAVWTSNLDGAFGFGNGFNYSGLSVGIHTITASAVDSGGLSDDDSITLTITGGETKPDRPARPSVTDLSDGVARINWTDLPNEDAWDLQRQEKVNGVWTNLTTVANNLPANTTSYVDNAGFGVFRYRVRAGNSAGESSWSPWKAVTLGYVPAAPTNLNATAIGGGQCQLTWTDNSDNEAKFQIQRQVKIGSSWSNQGMVAQPPADTESYLDNPGAGQFRYRVRAFLSGTYRSAFTPWKIVTVN